MTRRAFICGLAGHSLKPEERAFLSDTRPAGIILFARNVENPKQVAALIDEAQDAAGGDGRMIVMVDQEGGRVQRLCEPHWPKYPPARAFCAMEAADESRAEAANLCAQAMAADLATLGFNTTAAPVLDVPIPGADNIIGDRAYGEDVETVIALGRAVADGLLAQGLLPIMKHIPGHGRAMADSHLALPVVHTPLAELEAHDFAPFRALNDIPMAMTAHVVFTAVDPAAPVTVSAKAIHEVIRGYIGFDGLLMSDDLTMKALKGTPGENAQAALAAGCDLALHCTGDLDEMRAVAAASPVLEGDARRRFEAALARVKAPRSFDVAAAEEARAKSLVERI
ncbi:glycoside hydrolase family 3 domain protein [Rhodomicrobium vannielii ATCC 17100]|uniref:beta-N-acetylhexosaminidase n=1 Tax=Rhodomicrobium vannielii (strain ATCC 17100 / DSM 162 / LMG 4299 / NCIMB 10020 / ATH 3.1.1) TaxID=648757 RepID=E3I0R8_RHOVT|nr:beta-N-acetylhexosaminidase [Rhodomicrobium vannielii]ADP71158.1 glycoside hydrolase family 3 domain protein [Rhodomicrobium vannielii ATCC 17100]